jgi:hypothetical protein
MVDMEKLAVRQKDQKDIGLKRGERTARATRSRLPFGKWRRMPFKIYKKVSEDDEVSLSIPIWAHSIVSMSNGLLVVPGALSRGKAVAAQQ